MPMASARRLRRAAAWTGAVAALGGALTGVVLVLAAWLIEASVGGSATEAMRGGVLLFLAAQHGGVTLAGDTVGFLPLGLFAGVAVLPWRAGRTVAGLADDRGQRSDLRRALGCLTVTYAAVCLLLHLFARIGSTHTALLPTVVAAAVLAATVSGLGARRELSRRDQRPFLGPRWAAAGGAAVAAMSVLWASAALLLATSLALHGGSVMQLSRQVGGGGLGGLALLVLGMLCAPNAVIATSSLLAGPGFAVGSDTVIDVGGAHHGLLPSFPMLAGLPSGTGPHPLIIVWAAVTFAAMGAGAMMALVQQPRPRDAGGQLLVAALLAGGAMAVSAALAGGGLGSGRLAAVGASPIPAGLAVGGEVLVGGALAAGCRAVVRAVRRGEGARLAAALSAPEATDDADWAAVWQPARSTPDVAPTVAEDDGAEEDGAEDAPDEQAAEQAVDEPGRTAEVTAAEATEHRLPRGA